MTKIVRVLCVSLMFASISLSPASAAVITYSDLATFQAATNPLTVDNFEGANWRPLGTPFPLPVVNNGVSWTSPQGLFTSAGFSVSPDASLSALRNQPSLDQIDAALPSGTTAAGGFVTNNFSGGDIILNAFDTSNTLLGSIKVVNPTSYYFLGITSLSAPIARVEFKNLSGNGDMILDDFQFGTVIPIPGAAVLFLSALGGLSLVGWRKQSN